MAGSADSGTRRTTGEYQAPRAVTASELAEIAARFKDVPKPEPIYVEEGELRRLRTHFPTTMGVYDPQRINAPFFGVPLVVDPIKRVEQRERWRREAVQQAFVAWFNRRFPIPGVHA